MAIPTKRQICHSHFPYVLERYEHTVRRDLRPTKIKYSARKKGFCFTYRTSPAGSPGPAGQRGH